MTKVCTHGRGKDIAMQQLEESLRRLRTDHLDIWQVTIRRRHRPRAASRSTSIGTACVIDDKRDRSVKQKTPLSNQRTLITPSGSISELAKEAKDCRNCELWRNATQTVFGEGKDHPKIMFVGEQPGNEEDKQGKPFVGPAGHLLDRLLAEAGVDRKKVYVTNAVKHFKWEPRGKRRIHKKPNAREIAACRPWLDAEIAAVKPTVIVCLGATAAQALLGRDFRVTEHRGEFLVSSLAPHVMATVHPSSILRAPDEQTRHQQEKEFVRDMAQIAKLKI